jgi:hypothetical protein
VSLEFSVAVFLIAIIVLMAMTAFVKSGGGPYGGKIGEPDHEETVVPAEEPIPKPAPKPAPLPTAEPLPR